ncbi:hypothetical protein GOV12_00215 [Candidatus Pacearchaeota archaeon]|nr:hypothetical protein [Candidatus Pacearchaeota archaeon]
MVSLEFVHDKNRDIKNIWETANFSHPWEHSMKKTSGLYQWKDRSYEDCYLEIKDHVLGFHSSEVLPIFLNCLRDSWSLINDDYFNKLRKITDSEIYTDKFTAYLTIAGRCPYSTEDDSFMVSTRRPIFQNLRTCGHELLHLQMEKTHLPQIREDLDFRETEYVNESLTEILNLECKDLWLVNDFGYDEHQILREMIHSWWKNHKDIGTVIENCITYVLYNRDNLPFLDV